MAANGVDLATLDQLIEQRKKLIAQQSQEKEVTPSKRGQKKAEKRALESAMEGIIYITEPKKETGKWWLLN